MAVTSLNVAVFAASADVGEAVNEEVNEAAATGWVPLEDIEGIADISARGFVIRHIDKSGKVVKTASFDEAKMMEMTEDYSNDTPSYYTYGCPKLKYPSISKAEGVGLCTLLEKAGITFSGTQTLKLRTTDKLAEEMGYGKADKDGNLNITPQHRQIWLQYLNNPATIGPSAEYTTFTYEGLIGTPRYSFATGMEDAILANPGITQDEMYTDESIVSSGKRVEPMLCFGFGQIYVDEIEDSSTVENIPMTRKDAYRFCFGQAKVKDDTEISDENTRMQTAYNVFGIDIVD